MTLEFPAPVHYLLVAPDPRNHSIIDVKRKDTGALVYRKIRHMVPNLYALSLIRPDTYSVLTETQSLSSASKEKVIMLQEPENSVRVRLNGRLGFEWIFEWEGHKLRWIKESPLSNTLECHVVCTDMEICVAQYLPRNGIKGSYFGVYSVWQNNLALCQLKDPLGLKLAMMTILFTFFDKSDDDKRKKKDNYHLELEFQDLTLETQNIMDQTKLHKLDLETDKMLMKAQQKEDKRTEKQLKRSSAYSSTTTSPALSPIPSPSSSSTYADIAPSTKNTKRSAPLLRSLSYSSRDTRNRTPNKLTSFLTPFTKVSAAPVDPLAQKPVRHHQRALSVGVTDMSAVTTYHRY